MKVGYSPHTKGKMMQFRLEADRKARLEEKAKEFHMTVSEILREAVSVWLNLNNAKRGE